MTSEERIEFEKQKELAFKQLESLYSAENAPLSFKPQKSEKPTFNADLRFLKVKPKETFGLDFLRNFNFKNLKLNNDNLIIIALILLLCGEDKNELLILALIYIML